MDMAHGRWRSFSPPVYFVLRTFLSLLPVLTEGLLLLSLFVEHEGVQK
jgi:hypothetical protein